MLPTGIDKTQGIGEKIEDFTVEYSIEQNYRINIILNTIVIITTTINILLGTPRQIVALTESSRVFLWYINKTWPIHGLTFS